MDLNLPQGQTLSGLVKARYDAAKAAGSIIFAPSEVASVWATGRIAYQLRYCPSLAKKPTTENSESEDTQSSKLAFQKPDPFENPAADLFITNLPADSRNPSHILVLNKYPIIAQHFILATKAYKKQTHSLEKDDLAMTYACLRAWEDGKDGDHKWQAEQERSHKKMRLFAFFNSGEHSGASQSHRHIQFIPVEEMQAQQPGNSNWSLLMDTMTERFHQNHHIFHNHELPFQHFATSIPPNPSPDILLAIYDSLFNVTEYVLGELPDATDDLCQKPWHATHVDSDDPAELEFCYNLALTTTTMAICPRRAAGAMVKDDWANDVGYVTLNGTMLAGTMMVKGQKEWDFLRHGDGRETTLKLLLRKVGLPPGPWFGDYKCETAVDEWDFKRAAGEHKLSWVSKRKR